MNKTWLPAAFFDPNPKGISFRKALLEDAEWLLRLRNDPETRKQSLNQDPIAWQDHLDWLSASLNRSNRLVVIGLWMNQLVGSFRIDQHKQGLELSWTVAPEWRGKGLGSHMLRSLCQALPLHIPLWACVLQGNPASLKMAQKAGFSLQYTQENLLWLNRVSDLEATGSQEPQRY